MKQSFLRSLTKPPEIDDFSQAPPLVKIDPRVEPDWTSRNWEDEARAASAVLKNFPQLNGTRVNYYMIYVTYYLMNSEGTTIRSSRSLAAIEAAHGYHADDGMAAAQLLRRLRRQARRPARSRRPWRKALDAGRHRIDDPARKVRLLPDLHRPRAF